MRPEECYRLRWEFITWVNGRYGTLLVGGPLEGWVWPSGTRSGHIEPCTLKKQHKRALKLSGVRPFVLYSLRHTFLTRLGASGCDV